MKHRFILLLLAFTACKSNSDRMNTTETKSVKEIADSYYEERLRFYPLEATAIADTRYNDTLPVDISETYREKLRGFFQKYLDEMKPVDRTKLTEEDALTYDVFVREMNMQLEGLKLKDHLMPLNQFWGMHLTFPLLGSGSGNQPFKTVKDYDDFLKRITDFTEYVDTEIANMRTGIAEGIVPPKILMDRVIPQLEQIIVKDPATSVFYGPIKNIPASFSNEDKSRLTDSYKKAIMQEVVPAYQRLLDFVLKDYIVHCRSTAGISEIPYGKEYYAYSAKYWTTTDLSPDQIFEIGQNEVARLRSEMEKVMKETGYKGDLKSFFNYLQTEKKFKPFKKDEEVIHAYESIEAKMKPKLKELFNLEPKTKFEIRQTEEFREASASAEYNQGAPDGSRPGIFYVPIIDPEKISVVGMEDLFLHEAIPGHHYQISLQQENDSLPKFRRFGWYGAYGEGWALYTESLGKELGLYTDPYQYFGSLSEEMHRAIRLVVDVGIHMKGWTRERAIKFSQENEGASEVEIIAEIERYMAIPGQALAYKIGQLKIIEIRKRAEQKLGSKFNIKSFHDEVLKDGCLPIDVFEKKMDRWIKTQTLTQPGLVL